MKRMFAFACALALAPCLLAAREKEQDTAAAPAGAQPAERMKALEEQVRALAAEVQILRGELKAVRDAQTSSPGGDRLLAASPAAPGAVALPSSPEPAALAPQAPGGQLPVYGGAAASAKALNPDISVIGDFLGAVGHNNVRQVPTLELHESEVGLQAIIDPYARGDFFLSLSEKGVEVEEGYLTFTSLPAGLVAKVGKMRAAFGKVNTIHNHALEWTDRPLVSENLVNGEDGISDAGLSLTRILPAPKGIFLEGTAQVFRGDSGALFAAARGRNKDVSVVGHLRAYKDLSESTNVDVGFSYARGHSAPGDSASFLPPAFHTNLYGMDATFRWKPLRRAIYHSVLARTELVWSRRDQLSPLGVFETQRAFGFFTSAEYRLNRRWTLGGRYDWSERAANARLNDSGFSTLLTYWPSEFSQIRGQYRFARYAEGSDANELRFQFLFVLGAHGAHPF